jgi:hypothetical protein
MSIPTKSLGVAIAAPAGTCLLCHAVDESVTFEKLAAGEYWRCSRCGQMWDAVRLETAGAYSYSQLTH